MPNSKYGTFRNRTEVNTNVTIRQASEFIEKSASSVDAFRESTGTSIKAVIISEQKEGGNETILFTYAFENIAIGEFITYRKKTYLVYGEYEIIFSNEFKKHKLIECNVELKFGDQVQKGYYISSLRRYNNMNDLSVTNVPYEFSSQKPIIITKENTNIEFNTRFIIADESFVVNDIDKISNQGLYYLSMEKSTKYHDIDDLVNSVTAKVPVKQVEILTGDIIAGDNITIQTNFGYATFSSDVDIISKNATTVVFEAPIGVSQLIVSTKDLEGNIITTNYRIVI
jgi:hypothetical protein